jgi:hypothetical protein
MTLPDIISQVRLSIDEAPENSAGIIDGNNQPLSNDATQLDEIIKAKIGDALRWVCLYAPAELLTGSDEAEADVSIIYEGTEEATTDSSDSDTPDDSTAGEVSLTSATVSAASATGALFSLPGNFIKLIRVRGSDWHRAVLGRSVIEEDSDEYLQLSDTYACASADRPQAVLINKARKMLECFPYTQSVEITCIVSPSVVNLEPDSGESEEDVTVAVPPLIKTAFIYYLAFLTLSAYDDPRSTRMLEIAKMNLGRGE